MGTPSDEIKSLKTEFQHALEIDRQTTDRRVTRMEQDFRTVTVKLDAVVDKLDRRLDTVVTRDTCAAVQRGTEKALKSLHNSMGDLIVSVNNGMDHLAKESKSYTNGKVREIESSAPFMPPGFVSDVTPTRMSPLPGQGYPSILPSSLPASIDKVPVEGLFSRIAEAAKKAQTIALAAVLLIGGCITGSYYVVAAVSTLKAKAVALEKTAATAAKETRLSRMSRAEILAAIREETASRETAVNRSIEAGPPSPAERAAVRRSSRRAPTAASKAARP